MTGPTRETTTTRPKGPIHGPDKIGTDGEVLRDARGRPTRDVIGWQQAGKSRVCRDLTISCDGHRWYDRYYAAGQAQTAKERLEATFRGGWEFDPGSKRFVPPAQRADSLPTVFSESVAWWRAHWSTIEPKSRRETLRYVCRSILDLVHDGTGAPADVEAFLMWQLLPPKAVDTPIPAEHQDAASWLAATSMAVCFVVNRFRLP